MKNLYFICVSLLLAAFSVQAEDNNVFRHYSLSVGVGTTGVTGDLGTMVTDHLGLRGGVDYMPKFTYNTWLDMSFVNQYVATAADQYGVQIPANILEQYGLPDKVQVEGKYDNFTGHALLDIHPVKSSGFRFTVGAYIGKSDIVTVANKEPFMNPEYAGKAGIDLSRKGSSPMEKYTIVTDAAGNLDAKVKVNGFKPYLGIGFGRAVPKNRIGLQFDLGVQFWGKPELQTNLMYYDGEVGDFVTRYEKVEKGRITREDKDYKDVRDYLKTAEGIFAYPVLTFRLVGRIF